METIISLRTLELLAIELILIKDLEQFLEKKQIIIAYLLGLEHNRSENYLN